MVPSGSHDILIERRVIGRILGTPAAAILTVGSSPAPFSPTPFVPSHLPYMAAGKGGRDLEALTLSTGCEVYIIDK